MEPKIHPNWKGKSSSKSSFSGFIYIVNLRGCKLSSFRALGGVYPSPGLLWFGVNGVSIWMDMFNTIFGSFVAPTSSASRPGLATQVPLKHLTIPSDHLSCATKPSNSTDALPPTHHIFFLHAEAERPIAEICWRQKMHSLVSEWTTYAKIRKIESGAKRRNLAQLTSGNTSDFEMLESKSVISDRRS